MPAINRIYVGCQAGSDFADIVRNTLKENGDGDIEVEELNFEGSYGNVQLTEEGYAKVPDIEFLLATHIVIGKVFCHPQSKLKWAQTRSAGCDRFFNELKNTERKPDFIMTRKDDDFPARMGEYVIGQIISRERNFQAMYENQKQQHYERVAIKNRKPLASVTVGIIGLGNIGSGVAHLCKAVGMKVIGVVRDERYSAGETPGAHLDDVRPLSQLSSVLESCDYFVSVLPSTPQTDNLLSGDVLKPCEKKKTVLINIGRGSLIDDDSIVNAVRSGWLGGAILDVFNTEPLPSTSPLWTLPGVTITPHSSASSSLDSILRSFIYNLNAYKNGTAMKNLVDFDKGY